MAFWVAAFLISLITLAVLILPVLRRNTTARARAAYDLDVYRDQLAALDSDLERGVITPDEAEQTRLELSRRVLAADAALAQAREAGSAPPAATSFALGGTFAAVIGALGLYLYLGSPELEDAPLAPRIAEARALAEANRPTQDFAEAMAQMRAAPVQISDSDAALLSQLEGVLASRPDDVEGQRLLARSYMQVGRHSEGRAVQSRLVAQLGAEATVQDLAALAEYMIVAAGGYVSPEAEEVLDQVLARNPSEWFTVYYKARAHVQAGRNEEAIALLTGLAADATVPPALAAAVREDLARLRPGFGPTAEDIAAAQAMSPEDRAAMIEGMVEGLEARLIDEGGDVSEWMRLVQVRIQLGQPTRARAALEAGREALADDAAALEALAALAEEIGL